MVRSLVVLVTAALLAGCSDNASDTTNGANGDPSLGTLAGVVVDEAIRPVAGASVDVAGAGFAGANATTDAGGRFSVPGLEPGTYIVLVSKQFYSPHQQAVTVTTGPDELARFQLVFEPRSIPYASVYKYDGFHECGFNFVRVCSNINIATGIVLCSYDPPGLPCFNVTGDRSLFFQPIDGIPNFIQAELVWTPTTEPGRALNFYIGGGNISELQLGTASTYNFTGGESPLMLRITNHEGDSAWCRGSDPPCGKEALNESRIGTERVLLGQVDAGPTYPAPVPGCEDIGYCAVGFSAQQPFTMFTTVFYGYEPPSDWRFASGQPVPPPPT